jgi:putative DeoR family transcriptional regulator, stage III sporulation protein D
MINNIENFKIADYIIKNRATVRDAGNYFGISKSTVHVRIHKLPKFKQEQVQEVLNFNLKDRARRGGVSTQMKYRNLETK